MDSRDVEADHLLLRVDAEVVVAHCAWLARDRSTSVGDAEAGDKVGSIW